MNSPISYWTSKSRGNPEAASPLAAMLENKRMVVTGEAEPNATLQTGMIKAYAGRDPLTVRKLYCEPHTIDSTGMVNISTNGELHFSDPDVPVITRHRVIPFPFTFVTGEPNLELGERKIDTSLKELCANSTQLRNGFLHLLLDSLVRTPFNAPLQEYPARFKEAANIYIESVSDPLGRFLADNYERVAGGGWVLVQELLNTYNGNLGASEKPLTAKEFSTRVKNLGWGDSVRVPVAVLHAHNIQARPKGWCNLQLKEGSACQQPLI